MSGPNKYISVHDRNETSKSSPSLMDDSDIDPIFRIREQQHQQEHNQDRSNPLSHSSFLPGSPRHLSSSFLSDSNTINPMDTYSLDPGSGTSGGGGGHDPIGLGSVGSGRSLESPDNQDKKTPAKKVKREEGASSIAVSGGSGGKDGKGPRRAAQACLRCRKQKLKCVGGYPCHRCVKSKNECDFGRPGMTGGSGGAGTGADNGVSTRADSLSAEAANARLQQLESSVADLLAGLAGGNLNGSSTTSTQAADLLQQLGGHRNGMNGLGHGHSHDLGFGRDSDHHHRTISGASLDRSSVGPISANGTGSGAPWSTISPSFPRSLDRMDNQYIPSPLQINHMDNRSGNGQHVRFSNSPSNTTLPNRPDSSTFGSTGFEHIQDEKLSKGKKKKAKQPEPAERLAAATEGVYDPPFKALMYQPSIWENAEQSRRNSPEAASLPRSRDESMSGYHLYDHRFRREKDDPLNTGLVDMATASALFHFFVDHCHPFIPIVNVALDDAFNIIRQSPPLFSAICATAARFYRRSTERSPHRASIPPLDDTTPRKLMILAESHLGQTLLHKSHSLSDVQAIIILAAWGLEGGGAGPDAWIVTGHAARVARRLGVHKVLAHATETARVTEQGSEEWKKIEAFLPQWRTWLCWFGYDNFLSLGFGRPQSTYFESVDESAFLQIRLGQPLPRPGSKQSIALHGDVYIAGLVSLTQIGKDLVKWGAVLANPERADEDRMLRDWKRERDPSVTSMFKELNDRLDEWSRRWVWTGSPYALYLGSSARIARLQAEHLRLCLNSYALKARPDEDEMTGQCLKKAFNAAMSTIQTHYESSQTDLALSFATDYLTITLAQAAVFLVKITKAPEPVRAVVQVDPSVVAHYLKMAVDLLECADMSETRLSTFLAKVIRDIVVEAGITSLGPPPYDTQDTNPRNSVSSAAQPPVEGLGEIHSHSGHGHDSALGSSIDFEAFLGHGDPQLDLGSLLGLPGDNGAQGDLSMGMGIGDGSIFGWNEFGFGAGDTTGMNGLNALSGLNDMGMGNTVPGADMSMGMSSYMGD